tara:strand:+ start:260 stop:538 length:279 start_codon:yes stop_codon:yes gene_type:complete
MDEGNNCQNWSDSKREIRGCGSTCDCDRMKYDFTRYDNLLAYLDLIRDGMQSMDGVVDVDWNMMTRLRVIEHEERKDREERAKMMQKAFGVS